MGFGKVRKNTLGIEVVMQCESARRRASVDLRVSSRVCQEAELVTDDRRDESRFKSKGDRAEAPRAPVRSSGLCLLLSGESPTAFLSVFIYDNQGGFKIAIVAGRISQSQKKLLLSVARASFTPLTETNMSGSLPPEILDLIIDHLQDERNALEACCLVAKSWVYRCRKHLFARVQLDSLPPTIYQWMKAFPNPSNSPAHHTRDLFLSAPDLFTIASAWILHFNNIEKLQVRTVWWGGAINRLHSFNCTEYRYRPPSNPSIYPSFHPHS